MKNIIGDFTYVAGGEPHHFIKFDTKRKKKIAKAQVKILRIITNTIGSVNPDLKNIDFNFGKGYFKFNNENEQNTFCYWNRYGQRITILRMKGGDNHIYQSLNEDEFYLKKCKKFKVK